MQWVAGRVAQGDSWRRVIRGSIGESLRFFIHRPDIEKSAFGPACGYGDSVDRADAPGRTRVPEVHVKLKRGPDRARDHETGFNILDSQTLAGRNLLVER